mmetsp:Transcript_12318/g.25122  ORF Transcript_12318/g.25122 Transcript_12318/m.25122 type:complete len:200 (+) Transcript_12318:654-1253(+)
MMSAASLKLLVASTKSPLWLASHPRAALATAALATAIVTSYMSAWLDRTLPLSPPGPSPSSAPLHMKLRRSSRTAVSGCTSQDMSSLRMRGRYLRALAFEPRASPDVRDVARSTRPASRARRSEAVEGWCMPADEKDLENVSLFAESIEPHVYWLRDVARRTRDGGTGDNTHTHTHTHDITHTHTHTTPQAGTMLARWF